MKQNLGLVSVLIHDPKLLILDEPTTNLDPIGRKNLIKYIKKLSKGISIFVSSHILSEIEQMCEKVTIINKGKLLLTDTIANIKKSHLGSTDLFILDTSANQNILHELINTKGVSNAWIDEKDNKIHIVHKEKEKLQEIISTLILHNKIIIKSFYQPESSLQQLLINLATNRGE